MWPWPSRTRVMTIVCVQVTRDQVHKLEFPAPEEPGDAFITVYLMSDCIAGLDQQYTMRMQCDPAPAN